MSRPTKAIEAFDPTTLWPMAVYPSSVAPSRDHNRRNIARAIKTGGTHRGIGWRWADANSRLPEYLDRHTRHDKSVTLTECVELGRLLIEFRDWAGEAIDGWRVREMLHHRYGVEWVGLEDGVDRYGDRYARQVQVVKCLVWSSRAARANLSSLLMRQARESRSG